MTNPMPPGWYDDPDGSPNAERRWDGQNWTPERRRKGVQAAQPSYPQPAALPQFAQPLQAGVAYPQPPAPQPLYPPVGQASNTFSIIAFICAGISVLFFPIFLGPAALILGAVGLTKKERYAPIAIAAGAGCMIAGMVLGVASMGY